MRQIVRLFALVACTLLLFAACDSDEPEATDEPTDTPTATPGVSSLGEFQLVARIEHAFLSIEPAIELPADAEPSPAPGDEQEPAGVGGVMRGEIEAFSDNLGERCDADEGDRFNLYWGPGTLFDETLTARNLELSLEGRRVALLGSIYRADTADTGDVDLDLGGTDEPTSAAPTSTPVASPGVTTAEGEQDCVLVVTEVGISRTGALPTARPTGPPPRATLTPTPTAARTPTPTPTAARTPTPSPVPPTASPTPTDDETPSPPP